MKKINIAVLILCTVATSTAFAHPGYENYDSNYDYNRDGYYDTHARYDADRDRDYSGEHGRHDRERERKRLEEERRDLDAERQRLNYERNNVLSGVTSKVQQNCPAGYTPSENKCSPAERKHGCKDVRLSGGLGCVKR